MQHMQLKYNFLATKRQTLGSYKPV